MGKSDPSDADQRQSHGGQSHPSVTVRIDTGRCQSHRGGGDGGDLFDTTSQGFTQAQLRSTASYQAKDLQLIELGNNDLTGWDFSGQNLTYAIIRFSPLTGANFAGANLTYADLANSPLTGANLAGADLTRGV